MEAEFTIAHCFEKCIRLWNMLDALGYGLQSACQKKSQGTVLYLTLPSIIV